MPAVSPDTVAGLAVALIVFAAPAFDGVHAIVYPVIAAPLLAGAVKVSFNDPDATFAALCVAGAAGAPTITAPEAAFGPAPRAFVACTAHV